MNDGRDRDEDLPPKVKRWLACPASQVLARECRRRGGEGKNGEDQDGKEKEEGQKGKNVQRARC